MASAATITVTGSGDTVAIDGLATLREAITSINNAADVNGDVTLNRLGVYGTNDTINFNIPGAGVHTIQPTSALPAVTKPVTINGYTQGVATPNTLAVGNNAVLLIEIDGTNAGTLLGGLLEIDAGNSTVKGLVINRAQGGNSAALKLSTNSGSTVSGNFIGTDPTGTIARGNGCQGVGINSTGNTIGGLTPADRNVISATGGCGGNLSLGGSANNLVINNYLGTNAAGTASLGGSGGVVIGTGSTGNIIGGTTIAARNVISGNSVGVNIFDATTTGNIVEGNFIGTDASGALAVPNQTGVQFGSAASSGNTIGGTAAGAGNVIAFNTGVGVLMFGTPPPTGNAILGNSIFSNGGLGIDLGNDGVTANDACDADTGPNNLQNFPVITLATTGVGTTNIQGTLNSLANSSFRVEFFASPSCDPSGFGEGKTFLGSTTVPTDGTCNGSFNVTFPVGTAGQAITSTATRLVTLGLSSPLLLRARPFGIVPTQSSDTSEFSACSLLPAPTTTPTNTFTNTPTNTPTRTPTVTTTLVPATVTSTPAPVAAIVPMLSPSMLGLLALALLGAALFLVRRS